MADEKTTSAPAPPLGGIYNPGHYEVDSAGGLQWVSGYSHGEDWRLPPNWNVGGCGTLGPLGAARAPAAGAKYDDEKPPVELVPSELILAAARAFGHGAKKYARHNFKEGIGWSRLAAAAMRHLLAFLDREELDPDSNLDHLDHLAASVGMLVWMRHHRRDLDDRWKPGDGVIGPEARAAWESYREMAQEKVDR